MVSRDDMDKFEENEKKKIRPIKNTWYDWLINCFPEPIAKILGGFEDKIVSLFNINTPKQTMYMRVKKLSTSETQNKINIIRNPFIPKKEKIYRYNNLQYLDTFLSIRGKKERIKLEKKRS